MAEKIPVSYELAMQRLKNAQTGDELNSALREASRAFLREKILPFIKNDGDE